MAARGTFFGREGIQLKGHVETTGVVSVALFAINNDYVTYVDPATGLPYRAEQTIRETARTAATFADFNQPAGVAVIPAKALRAFLLLLCMSAIYRVRTLPLTNGSSYSLTVQSEKQNYLVELRVTGLETIKTNVGSFNTKVCQVRIRNESQGHTYNLRAYFTDDPRHVPVLMTSKLSAGEIRAELAGSGFVATPPVTPTPTPTPVPGVQPPRNPLVIPATPDNSGDLKDLPFKVGEQLNYQVFLPSVQGPVGNATFHVRARSKYFEKDGLFFRLSAQTTNALQKLFVANDTISHMSIRKLCCPFNRDRLNEGLRRSSSTLNIIRLWRALPKRARIEFPSATRLPAFSTCADVNMSPPTKCSFDFVNTKPKTSSSLP